MVFRTWKLKGDCKVIIDCYNGKNNIPSLVNLSMEDIWKLLRNLNIFNCCYIYREANRTMDYLVKKDIYNTDSNI